MKIAQKKNKINKFEISLLIINLSTYCIWIIFNNDLLSYISFFSYFFYVFSLYFASIGKWISHIFNILSNAFYIYICIYFFYLGELVSTIFIIIISVVLFFEWRRNEKINKNGEKQLEMKKVKPLELLVSNTIAVVVCVSAYFLFRLAESSEPLLNAIIFGLSWISYYYYYRISKWSFIYKFLNIITYLVLWIITLQSGLNVASIYIIGTIFSIIWTTYSFYNWNKLEKINSKEYENKVIVHTT